MSVNSSKTGVVAKKGQVMRERALPGPKKSNPAHPKRNDQQHTSAAMLVLEKGKKSGLIADAKTLELSRLSFLFMLQEAFKCISSSASRVDLLHGLNGAPMFSQIDLQKLDDFIQEISLNKKDQHNITAQAAAAAVHYQKLLDNSKEKVAGSSYSEIKSMMDRLIASGYLASESVTENLEPGQPEECPSSSLGSVVEDEELSTPLVDEVLPEESKDQSPRGSTVGPKRKSMYRTPFRTPRRASRGFAVSSQMDEDDSKRTQFHLSIVAQNPKLLHWNKMTPRRTPLHPPAKHGGVLKVTRKYVYTKSGKNGWQNS